MITGMSMGLETCLILGQVSLSFFLLEEKPPDGYMWSKGRLTKRQVTSRPDHLWPELWRGMSKNAQLREKHKWAIGKPKLDNARRLRGIYLLTLRTRSSKKPSRMPARNWKHRWLLLCLARQAKTVTMGKPVVRPMISNQNLRVRWKPVNPQDCVWKDLYRIIMRTILLERETIHCNIIILFTNVFLCLKP